MKKKHKDNPLLITGQDSNLKVTEKIVVTAAIFDSTHEFMIVYDKSKKDKELTFHIGKLMAPELSLKISTRDLIDKLFPDIIDLPF